MGEMAGLVIRSIFLSFIMGISCQTFFGTVAPLRRFRYGRAEHMAVLAFTAGFMVIAVTKIPPYFWQPVRVIAVVFLVAQIFVQVGVVKNLLLSVVFCGIYWLLSALVFSLVYIMFPLYDAGMFDMKEPIIDIGYLVLMLAFRNWFRKRVFGLAGIPWRRFGLLSLMGIAVSAAVIILPGSSTTENYARLAVITGFAAAYVLGIHYMVNVLEKEAEMQELRMVHERTRNQMNLYQSMKERYEQQRCFSHDYKNQLSCIQGMIENGQTQEALRYISGLNGRLRQGEMYVNTNHAVVNIMLNRKYQEACGRGIVMTIASGDLSGLTIGEEDIVTLLGNLLDNAIEACEKLSGNKVIQFKMVIEEGQLVLAVRNPTAQEVRIKDNRIVTGKRDKEKHGIGLLNVDSVIRRNNGTSILKCEDGWFTFAAMIPLSGVLSGERI